MYKTQILFKSTGRQRKEMTAFPGHRKQVGEVLSQDTTLLIQPHVINEEVRAKIQQAIGPHEDLLTIAKRSKRQ